MITTSVKGKNPLVSAGLQFRPKDLVSTEVSETICRYLLNLFVKPFGPTQQSVEHRRPVIWVTIGYITEENSLSAVLPLQYFTFRKRVWSQTFL